MKKLRRMVILLLAAVMCIGMMSINVLAASTSQDGLEVTWTTDKEEYTKNEPITATLTVENTNDFAVTNVSLEQFVPDGYQLSDGSSTAMLTESLKAGESVALTLTYEPASAAQNGSDSSIENGTNHDKTDNGEDDAYKSGDSGESNGDSANSSNDDGESNGDSAISSNGDGESNGDSALNSNDDGESNGNSALNSNDNGGSNKDSSITSNDSGKTSEDSATSSNGSPKTGDKNGVIVLLLMIVSSAAAMFFVLRKTKIGKTLLSLFFCAALFATLIFPNVAQAATVEQSETCKTETVVMVDGYEVKLLAKVTYDMVVTTEQSGVDQSDTTDSDGDGVPDWVELEFGSDPTVIDTDGDLLNDYDEIFNLSSDPSKADSDDNGVSDAEEDFDGDGISNIEELSNETNPVSSDTDGDAIPDNEESLYGTDVLLADTDGDGAEDGWEIANDFDPLVKDDEFAMNIEASEPSATNPVTAGVNVTLDADGAASLSVEPVDGNSNPYLSSNMAGYLGSAYEFSTTGTFSNATLTFKYDTELGTVGDDFQPRIYYYDEENGLFEELENQVVSDGTVTAEVSHFSCYVLLNKKDFDAVWNEEIKPSVLSEDDDTALDFVFVVDYSLSMETNDPNKLFNSLSNSFIDKFRDGIDRAAVVKFIKKASLVQELTSDREALSSALDSISYDNGYGTYSGTDGSAGLRMALDELSTSDSAYKCIIFMTDGEDNGFSYSYSSLIEEAQDAGVIIYTIGMGSASESVLKEIADSTGGAYFHATADENTMNADDILDLASVYKEIEADTIDLTKDANDDGIPDYYNDLILSGDLVLGNGSTEFAGIDFNYDSNGLSSDDWDGDGLINGAELKITQKGDKVYIKMVSSPVLKDSDNDGIEDAEDTAPLKKGLAGGITGELTLVSCYNSEYAGWTSGHVFFVYTSYINDKVDFSTLAAGWSKINTEDGWTWDNLQRDNPLLSEYVLSVGESATIGNGAFDSGWFGCGDSSGSSGSSADAGSSGSSADSSASGTGDENGVCYNMEVYKHLNAKISYLYLSNTFLSEDITESQLEKLISYCSKGSVNYWSLTHNCAEVACQAWNLISDTDVSPYSDDFFGGKIATPKGLKINLRTIPESAENYLLGGALNP